MSLSPLIGMMIWVAFVTSINLAVTIASYAYNVHILGLVSIATSVILFGCYVYSVWTRNKYTSPIQSKFLRSVLILIPTGLLLFVHIQMIVNLSQDEEEGNKYLNNLYDDRFEVIFESSSYACEAEAYCFMTGSHLVLGIITGVFALVETRSFESK
ncbi:MAG: hypothetical protein J3R72DRAFT_500271 [Linnemannia gamsii]|nr:MAG: hypothetical protein J3R72DRAFT_500271 [Linnemannia gamsii]